MFCMLPVTAATFTLVIAMRNEKVTKKVEEFYLLEVLSLRFPKKLKSFC